MLTTDVPQAKPFEVRATGYRGTFGPVLENYSTIDAAEAAHSGNSLDKLLVVVGPDPSHPHDLSKQRVFSRRASSGKWQRPF